MSNIVPIPKLGDSANPKNYRPISLLSILSKIFERHIRCLLMEHVIKRNLISESQWGFLSGRSTTAALLSVTDCWHKHLEAGREVCAIFLDLQKAFDSVPHRSLLLALQQLDIHPTLLKWLCSYLTNRVQKVVVNGECSSDTHVLSGVPQGSVLGPLLFLLYVNSITNVVLSPGSEITLYADDILLSRAIKDSEDLVDLQEDMNALSQWSACKHLNFNPDKCKFMIVTRKRNQVHSPILLLNGHAITRVFHYKYLGVTLSSDLSWSKHVHDLCTRAKKMLGLLYRTFYLHSSSTNLLQLYVYLIRPCLEYACVVWNPHLQRDIEKLEKVQKFALRLCVKQWDMDYTSLLSICILPTLTTRRKYFILCTMYKIVNHLIDFPPNVFLPRATSLRSTPSCLYLQPFSHTNSYLFSFVPNTCSQWNKLPFELRSTDTLSSFKSSLREWLNI